MKIGILALQGAFIEHRHMFDKLEISTCEIRLPSQLEQIDALVIPGGESTTLMKLMNNFDMMEPLRDFAGRGHPVWGTCAGMICLAKDVTNPDSTPMETLALMDISVQRNAFGRQVDSFETDLDIEGLGDPPFPAIFIRAPFIDKANQKVEILATLPKKIIVAARQNNLLVTSFHPELTDDTRLHLYFSRMVGS